MWKKTHYNKIFRYEKRYKLFSPRLCNKIEPFFCLGAGWGFKALAEQPTLMFQSTAP